MGIIYIIHGAFMGHLNENNEMFPNFVNVRFWHKADIDERPLSTQSRYSKNQSSNEQVLLYVLIYFICNDLQ